MRRSQCRLEAGPIRISEEAPRLCRSPHPHPGASACLPDWRRLNTATRRKLGSHSSIFNKNAEVGMTHDKSTVHESYSSNLFNYLLAQCVSPKTIRKKCAVRPEPGQEVLEPGCFGGPTHLQGRPVRRLLSSEAAGGGGGQEQGTVPWPRTPGMEHAQHLRKDVSEPLLCSRPREQGTEQGKVPALWRGPSRGKRDKRHREERERQKVGRDVQTWPGEASLRN